MFTGIVRAVGRVEATEERGAGRGLTISTGGLPTGDWHVGDSICVAGACLTATAIAPGRFDADLSRETIARTTLGSLAVGSAVNLEPALAAGDALGGHFVAGHVDGVAEVVAASAAADSQSVVLALPAGFAKFMAPKGSVTIDGVSLTVNRVDGDRFEVALVPATLRATTLGSLAPGARVNFEVDLIARYLERLAGARGAAP